MIQWSQLEIVETITIAAFAIFIWLIFTWLALRQKRLQRAIQQSLLLALALFCLCLTIYKPKYSVRKPGGKALLLTQNVKAIPDSIKVFGLPQINAPATVQRVPDLAFIERNFPEITQVYIDGYELEPEQIQHLERVSVVFLKNKAPAGFTWLTYTRQVQEGEELIVSGTYFNYTPDTLKLLFSSVKGVQDSVFLPSGEKRFSLRAGTRIPGLYTATMQLVGKDTTRTELLPYEVKVPQPLRVLMLQGFPSYEMNYLKDWLAEGKHAIQVRARISRDKYSMQNINHGEITNAKPILAEENLSTSDILISDAESVRQLSQAEKSRLEGAIGQGLGLVVLADEQWLKNPQILSQKFLVSPSGINSFVPRQEKSSYQGTGMADKLPAAFNEKSLLVPIMYSRAGELITTYLPSGKGRIGVQLATATFPWILQGEKDVYSSLWTDILKTLSRRLPGEDIRLEHFPFVFKDHPKKFTVSDTVPTPATITYSSGMQQVTMPEKEAMEPFGTSYQFLPAEQGWIKFGFGEDTTRYQYTYVLPPNAWIDLKQADWWRQHQTFNSITTSDKSYAFTARQDVPLIWFFLPLVGALAMLWFDRKS